MDRVREREREREREKERERERERENQIFVQNFCIKVIEDEAHVSVLSKHFATFRSPTFSVGTSSINY